MFIRWILPLSVTLALGILIGRLSVNSTQSTASVDQPERAKSPSTRTVEPSPHRDRQRERSTPVPSENRVSIPADLGGKLLADSKFLSCGFDEIGGRLEQALTLLGATPGQRDAVIDLFKRTEQEIYETEKKHVGVRTSGDSEIWLNMFDMEDHAPQIIKNTREGIAEILDPAQTEALNRSIDWSKFYNTSYSQEVLLTVVRRDGMLHRTENSGSSGSSTNLPQEKFPPNTSSLPASEVFKGETRMNRRTRDWSHLLEGKTLVPIDKKPSLGG